MDPLETSGMQKGGGLVMKGGGPVIKCSNLVECKKRHLKRTTLKATACTSFYTIIIVRYL